MSITPGALILHSASAAIAAIVAPVTDAAIKVFNVWSHADDKQRDEIREELKLLRWANFLEI